MSFYYSRKEYMYKPLAIFGDVSTEEIERITKAMSDYYSYMDKFQNREIKESSEVVRSCVRGPHLKSYTVTRIKR